MTRVLSIAALFAATAASFFLPSLHVSASSCSLSEPRLPSGIQNVTIAIEGQGNRVFQLSTPWFESSCNTTVDGGPWCTGPPNTPRPLVFNWHGCNAHMPVVAYHEALSRVVEAGLDNNYYVITPVGSYEPLLDKYGWNTLGIKCGTPGFDDFFFAEELLKWAKENLCVDEARIYNTGFSTGAFFSYELGCRLPKTFRGIATVAGSMAKEWEPLCSQGSGVNVISYHSKGDTTVPYEGNSQWLSQPEMTKIFEKKAGCTMFTPSHVTFLSQTTVCTSKTCPGDGEGPHTVEQCTVSEIEHCWIGGRSGGFKDCEKYDGDIDATSHMFAKWEREAAGDYTPFDYSNKNY